VAGVDTHKRTHHAAVLDAHTGKLLADHEFATTQDGYRKLLSWMDLTEPLSKQDSKGPAPTGQDCNATCRPTRSPSSKYHDPTARTDAGKENPTRSTPSTPHEPS